MKKYKKHIFVCVNQRENNLKKSCGNNGLAIRDKFVEELRKLNLNHEVRANKSGCLAGCSQGPIVVIYPNQIWYKNVTLKNVSEIINESIIKDKIINKLALK